MNQKPAKGASQDGAAKNSSQKGGNKAAPITPRAEDYAQWYIDIVRKAELADTPACAAAW